MTKQTIKIQRFTAADGSIILISDDPDYCEVAVIRHCANGYGYIVNLITPGHIDQEDTAELSILEDAERFAVSWLTEDLDVEAVVV